MKGYAATWCAFVRRSNLISGLVIFMALTPLEWAGIHQAFDLWPGLEVALILATFMNCLIGTFLGLTCAILTECGAAQTVPGYRPRILRCAAALGLVLWLPVPISLVWGPVDLAQAPLTRWTPLLAYGLMGLGFMYGYWASRKEVLRFTQGRYWLQLALECAPYVVIYLCVTSLGLRLLSFPLVPDLPGFNLMALACLLLGPLAWPAWFRASRPVNTLSVGAKLLARDYIDQSASQAGSALDTWLLTRWVQRWHSRGRLRPEYMLLSNRLLAMFGAAVMVAIFPLIGVFAAKAFGVHHAGVTFTDIAAGIAIFLQACLLGPVFDSALNVPMLGRALLMPGQTSRKALPGWLFARLWTYWLSLACLILVVAAAWGLWFQFKPQQMALVGALLLANGTLGLSFSFWRTPGRKLDRRIDMVSVASGMLLSAGSAIETRYMFGQWTTLTSLGAIMLTPALAAALFFSGRRRWRQMQFGVN